MSDKDRNPSRGEHTRGEKPEHIRNSGKSGEKGHTEPGKDGGKSAGKGSTDQQHASEQHGEQADLFSTDRGAQSQDPSTRKQHGQVVGSSTREEGPEPADPSTRNDSEESADPSTRSIPGLPESDQTRWTEMPFIAAKGFVMGSADVVPGVSGGTMALILGIYSRLIFAVRSIDLPTVRAAVTFRWGVLFERLHWKFLLSLLVGGVAAVLFFTKVVALPVLMHTHPEIIYGLFFGLIAGSIWLLLRKIGRLGHFQGLVVAIGILVGLRIVTLVPTETPETSLFVFLSGSLAVTAMVLPGISGSFILLILRKYDYILSHIALLGTDRTLEAVLVLVPFGLGMITGLLLFIRVLSWLLKRFRILTLCLLVGFMAGSLYVIWPYQDRTYTEVVQVRELPADDEQVLRLQAEPQDRLRPEYSEVVGVVNPQAPRDEQLVEVREVRRRLVSSRPFWPFSGAGIAGDSSGEGEQADDATGWTGPERGLDGGDRDGLVPGVDGRERVDGRGASDPRLVQGRLSLYGGMASMIAGFLFVGLMGRFVKDSAGDF